MLDQLWNLATEALSQNQFLSGGAILAGAGIALAYLRRLPSLLYAWGSRRVITRVDILDRDEAFTWVVQWLAKHPYKNRCRLWTVKTSNSKNTGDSVPYKSQDETTSQKKKDIILSPAPGPHFFFYKKRLVVLRRHRQEGGDLKGGTLGIQERFDLTIFTRKASIVRDLLQDARDAANPDDKSTIRIYRSDWSTWVLVRKQTIRPMGSVILDDGVATEILDDVKDFKEAQPWYQERGIPYRRGYLLYGSPGNGKSSLVTALASELGMGICSLSLSSAGLNDQGLISLFSEIPPGCLVLIEDIDCAFDKREQEDYITFSGLLNALDGIVATEGRIVFMTTNYRDKLDEALIRPGRCDVEVKFNNATETQGERLFAKFFPESSELGKDFGVACGGGEYSMAHLQGVLIKHKDNPKLALTSVQK